MSYGALDLDNSDGNESAVKSLGEAQDLIIQVLNFGLGEHQSFKLVQRTFDEHKKCEVAQESHLQQGDCLEVMTNTLTYDLDQASCQMIASSIAKNVRYVYYLEENDATRKSVVKFVNQLIRFLSEWHNKEEIADIISNNLELYWLPANKFPYSFALFDRPEEATLDHCVFYFLRDGMKCKYIFETRLENAQNEVAVISKVFKWFRNTFDKIDTYEIIDKLKGE